MAIPAAIILESVTLRIKEGVQDFNHFCRLRCACRQVIMRSSSLPTKMLKNLRWSRTISPVCWKKNLSRTMKMKQWFGLANRRKGGSPASNRARFHSTFFILNSAFASRHGQFIKAFLDDVSLVLPGPGFVFSAPSARHICRIKSQTKTSPVGAAYSGDVAPDGA